MESIDCIILKHQFIKCLKTDQKDEDLRKVKVKPVTPKFRTFGGLFLQILAFVPYPACSLIFGSSNTSG